MNRILATRSVLLLMIVLLVAASCATGSDPTRLDGPNPILDSGSVVFQGPDANIFVIAWDRSQPIRLTSGAMAGRLSYPAYAWAGDRVVYVAHDRSADGRLTAAFYTAVPGGRSVRVWRDDSVAPFFLYPSPDGSRVGYLGGSAGTTGFRMESVDLGNRQRVVHGVGQPFYTAWSPSGTQIVSHINGAPGRAAALRIDDVDTLPRIGRAGVPSPSDPSPSVPSPLGSTAAPRLPLRPGAFQTPAYNADGSRIAVVLRNGAGSGIHFLDATGEDLGRLADTRGAVAMSFAPDGNSISYIDGGYSATGSVVGPLVVAGATNRRLSDAATAFFWSPDSLKLVFFEPYLTRDGSPTLMYRVRMYSVIDRQVFTVATMRPAQSFTQQIVPFFDQYARGYSIWSPDSRLLALNTVSIAGSEVIHLVDTDTVGPFDFIRVSASGSSDTEALGLVPGEGVRSRPLAFGSNPFFAPE
ncbi:MAG: hypothetical protein EA382_17375 [Spirochaetaceae bacterium]|nr:MAG: hypothetical protein EA382_17375 [Spirochaetaceae bacterium]